MDTLPLEMQVEILSYLNLNDLAKLRTGSKSDRHLAEHYLKSITHISLPGNNLTSLYEREAVCSYNYQEYLSKPFVLANPGGKSSPALNGNEKTPNRSFFSFLGTYCPNLQVLNGPRLTVTYDRLMQLPKSLRFFKCEDIRSVAGGQVHHMEEVLAHLNALECFDAFSFSYKSYNKRAKLLLKLAQERHKHNKPVALFNPAVKLVDRKTYESFNVRNLVYGIYEDRIHRFHPIYPAIAANLVDLRANFVPSDSFCQAPLPMLRYLSLWGLSLPPTCKNVLFTSPNLICFRIDGLMDVTLLETIFAHLHSLKYLQVIVLCPQMEGKNRATVVFPSQVREFEFQSNCELDLTSCSSSSMVRFKVGSLVNWDFEFPNLRELTLSETKFPSFPRVLLESLLVSSKLRLLHLSFTVDEVPTSSSVQSMVDACAKCKMLTSIKLVCKSKGNETDEGQLTSGEVAVKQDDFLLVRNLHLSLPCHLVFHPNDRFNSLQVVTCLELTDEKRESTFKFECSQRQRICFKEDMKQLTRVQVNVQQNSWIVEQLEFLTHIEELSLPLKSYGKGPVLTDDESLAKIFSSKKLKLVKLEGKVNTIILCRVFGILLSLELLTEVSLDLEFSEKEKNQEQMIPVSVPPRVERMSIKSNIPIGFSSASLKYLKAGASSVCSFICPNLEEADFEATKSRPTDNLLNSLRHCAKLKQLTLFILKDSCFPSAEYLQDLLTTASKMKCLSNLHIGRLFGSFGEKVDGCVKVIQSDFPSVESFRLFLPIRIVFHPLNVFKTVIVDQSGSSISFKCSPLCYVFSASHCDMLTVRHKSKLRNITKLIVSIDPYRDPWLTEVDPLAQIHAIEHLPNIKSVKFDGRNNEFIKSFASLPRLQKLTVTRPIDQEDVLTFLLTVHSDGPIELEFMKASGQVGPMSDLLHEVLNNLKDGGVVSSFVSRWSCNCQGDCWLKKQQTQ